MTDRSLMSIGAMVMPLAAKSMITGLPVWPTALPRAPVLESLAFRVYGNRFTTMRSCLRVVTNVRIFVFHLFSCR